MSTIRGGSAGSATGINADEVTQSSVSIVSVGTSPLNCTGISADVITECRVSTLSAAGSGNVAGLSGYRLARSCVVNTLSTSGAGKCYGAATSWAGRTEDIMSLGTLDVGISVNGEHTIIGCTTEAAVTGILANSPRNVIDGNNITGPSSIGISVTAGNNTASALVIRNQVRNCTVNFDLDTPCQSGPIISATGAIAAGANPWANFTD